jgi:hypothetical protein
MGIFMSNLPKIAQSLDFATKKISPQNLMCYVRATAEIEVHGVVPPLTSSEQPLQMIHTVAARLQARSKAETTYKKLKFLLQMNFN